MLAIRSSFRTPTVHGFTTPTIAIGIRARKRYLKFAPPLDVYKRRQRKVQKLISVVIYMSSEDAPTGKSHTGIWGHFLGIIYLFTQTADGVYKLDLNLNLL